MNYRIAIYLKEHRNSIIREIAERGSGIEGFCTFALGNPASEGIPIELLNECVEEILKEEPLTAYRYGPIEGDEQLKEWVRDRMTRVKGFEEGSNRVMMTAGAGRTLGYVPRALCEEGEEAYFDRFSYPNSTYSVRNIGAKAVSIPMDASGMIPEALERAAKSGKGKYIYLIPNFHNPLGMTMPLARRKEIYEVARNYDLLIYEDDPYGEIHFTGDPVPSFKSFDKDERVIYVGSFSKTLSSGLRVGYVFSPMDLDKKLRMVRGGDGQDSLFPQVIIRKALQRMDFEEHLDRVRGIYGQRAQLMISLLEDHLPKSYEFVRPQGGMFVWVTVPEHTPVNALSEECIRRGVGIVRSEAFCVDPADPGNAFRLNFSGPSEADMKKGIRILGEVCREFENSTSI